MMAMFIADLGRLVFLITSVVPQRYSLRPKFYAHGLYLGLIQVIVNVCQLEASSLST